MIDVEALRKFGAARDDDNICHHAADELERLRAALAWYADDETWVDRGDAESYQSRAREDAGARAKAILNQQQAPTVRDDPHPDGEYDANGKWVGPTEPTERH